VADCAPGDAIIGGETPPQCDISFADKKSFPGRTASVAASERDISIIDDPSGGGFLLAPPPHRRSSHASVPSSADSSD
jgi:hypothetical protein